MSDFARVLAFVFDVEGIHGDRPPEDDPGGDTWFGLSRRYNPGMSLERINNERGYEPGNVVWANARTQGRNRRNNIRITIGNTSRVLADWSQETGIPAGTISDRLARGLSPEVALGLRSA